MAERVEEPEGTIDTILDQPSSAAMALALGRTSRGKAAGEVNTEAISFLRKQSRLIDLQTEHLHEQRALILSRLRWGRFSDRIKALLQVLTLLVGLAVLIGVAAMAWQAHEDHGLVVRPFSVSPDLAQRGLTGQVVAARLLDRLSKLQAETVSARPASTYADDWGDDIKVEIPETGVSIGELNRYMRQWLGSETQVTGEVVRTPTGFQVTARAGTGSGQTVEGPESDIDGLITQAAEAIYGQTQPYRFAHYLLQHGRQDQGLAALVALANGPPGEDRVYADHDLQFALMDQGNVPGAIARAEDAVRIAPNSSMAWDGLGETQRSLGHDEAALAAFRRALPLSRRNTDALPRLSAELVAWQQGYGAEYHGDFQTAATEFEHASQIGVSEGLPPNALVVSARDFGLAHDGQASDAAVQAAARAASGGAGSSALTQAELVANIGLDRWLQASGPGQTIQRLLSEPIAPKTPAAGPELSLSERERLKRSLAFFAYAKAMTSDVAGASAMIDATPLDCYDCVRLRGRIAAVGHDWPSAHRWFVEAVRQGPSIPMGYSDWGDMLLAKGDLAGAIAKYAAAEQRGPHFADPLEAWGEALMAKHDYAGAISKFTEANKDAPKWGRNHLRWGEALMLSGRYAEARAQYQLATSLDLSAGDRAALNMLLARTAKGPLHG